MNNNPVLEREFLEIRSRILDIAASLDRIDRTDKSPTDDQRMDRIKRGLEIVLSDSPDRAEQIQMLFSRAYDQDWRDSFQS